MKAKRRSGFAIVARLSTLRRVEREEAWIVARLNECKTPAQLRGLVRWARQNIPESMATVRRLLKGRVPC